MLDSLFFSVYTYYKNSSRKRSANDFALLYIDLVSGSFLALLFLFLYFFIGQMNSLSVSGSNAVILFIITFVALLFRNWIYYTGKKRTVLYAAWNKKRDENHSIYFLWALPIAMTIAALILLQKL